MKHSGLLLSLLHIAFAQGQTTCYCPDTITVTAFPPDYTGTYTTPAAGSSTRGFSTNTSTQPGSVTPASSPLVTNSPASSTPSNGPSQSFSLTPSAPSVLSTGSASISTSGSFSSSAQPPGPSSSANAQNPAPTNAGPSSTLGVSSSSEISSSAVLNAPSSSVLSSPLAGPSSSTTDGQSNTNVATSSLAQDSGLSTFATTTSSRSGTSSAVNSPLPTATRIAVYSCPNDDGLNYVSPSGKAYRIACRTNEVGYDQGSQIRADLEQCVNTCGFRSGCIGISWVQATQRCYYKSATGMGVPDQGFDSAVPINLTCPDADGAQYIDNKGYAYEVMCDTTFPAAAAADMTTQPGLSVQDCSNTCSNVTNCDISTYSDGMCTFLDNGGSRSGVRTLGRNSVVLLYARSGSINAAGNTVLSTSTPDVVPTYSVSRSIAPIYSTPTVYSSESTPEPSDISEPGPTDSGASGGTTSSGNSGAMGSDGPSATASGSTGMLPTTLLPTDTSSGVPSILTSSGRSISLSRGPTDLTTITDNFASSTLMPSFSLSSATLNIPTSLPLSGSLSLGGSLPGMTGASTTASPPLATSTSLACDGTQEAYNYVDPSSGNVYTVECNTTYSGGIFAARQEPDMASCINQCSNDPTCEAAGYDASTGYCYEYNAEVPNSGIYSLSVQFAQRKIRAVVQNGVTMSYSVTTVSTSNGVNVQGGTTYTYLPPPTTIFNTNLLTNTPSISLGVSGGISASIPSGSIGVSVSIPPISIDLSGGLSASLSYHLPTGIPTLLVLSSATIPVSAGPTETAVAYACPANDGQIVSQNGLSYVLSCGGALAYGGSYAAATAANSFNDCFRQCDQSSVFQGALYCTGFTYMGAANGAGSGSCYLYDQVAQGFVAGNSSTVGAIRLINYVQVALPTIPLSIGASVGASASVPTITNILPSITAPLNSLTAVIPGGLGTTTAPTCANGGNILNGCIVASITPNPSLDPSAGIGLNGPSSSTILGVGVSATLGISASVGLSLGLGVGLSSGLSIGLDPSLGLGLGATAGAGVSVTVGDLGLGGVVSTVGNGLGGAVSTVGNGLGGVVSGVGNGLGGILGAGSSPSTSSLRTTTVLSTTTITSCSSVLGGQLTCPGGASNTLLASVSTATALPGSATTVYIAFTTTVTTAAMTSSAPLPSSSACSTLLGGIVSCELLSISIGIGASASVSLNTCTTLLGGVVTCGGLNLNLIPTTTTSLVVVSSSSRSSSAPVSAVVTTTSTSRSSGFSTVSTAAATTNCGGLVNGVVQVCASPLACIRGVTC
ncbi:hypothetical protein LTR56_001725 [Elasticomyces elasticus]|nr:hypothetical protein LTR56_001725 [Elasticomyces elasticus]KAK3667223.1 hypothetical protein LTR22_001739 [Elasticomyces elasticus]KAK4932697.1 hypothetical protein LTR49_001121 [Elasticomyces elasticus]KAK5769719.1 hypothetical protein LTS12_000169 [Elasticomyces elasticus]